MEKTLVDYFNEGGGFMWPILFCLIIGLAISIERFVTLSRSGLNTRKFLVKIKQALDEGGIQRAIEVSSNQRGSVAAIFHAGLLRAHKGVDQVEKAIVNAGAIEMAFLERGMVWIGFFIAIAPMLGFTGTVQGMIQSFESIAKANDISPTIVASGISVALLTTLFGLIVAMVLQFFHNYFTAKINRLVVDMEETSAELVETMVELEHR
ncbi:MAG: MotA/TolQ/ExbB proton channel family protein [Bacteroidetes bacterium]|nr:MotA/TolQ/ExbB proton channel family protein [Bacteroidota bacterium]